MLREIDVLVHVTDVDVHQNEVGLENRPVRVIVKIDIQHLAIAAPVPAEIDQVHACASQPQLLRAAASSARACAGSG